MLDLYEQAHFKFWNSMSLLADAESVIIKRGVRDELTGTGMRRISGAVEVNGGCLRIGQSVFSRAYNEEQVTGWLAEAGLRRVPLDVPVPDCPCGQPDPVPCWTIYGAVKD